MPGPSKLKATGRPVSSVILTCPDCGALIPINDFGQCDRIKKVKGFAAIVRDQDQSIQLTRRQVEECLALARKRLGKALKPLQWNDHTRQTLLDTYEALEREAWARAIKGEPITCKI